MQAIFGIKREMDPNLFVADYCIKRGSTLHFHSQIELIQVTEGAVEVWINEKKYVLREGEAAIATSYQAHLYNAVGESAKATVVCVPTELCEDFVAAAQATRISTILQAPETLARISLALSALHAPQLNEVEKRGYIGVMLGAILHHTEPQQEESFNSSLLSKLLLYINANYKENISLSVVASALGYSPHYVAKHFRSCFHMPLGQYINTIRLRNAVILLRERKLNVTSCALESGFNSVRTFYRAFLEEFGCTPREYLKAPENPAAVNAK